MKIAVCGSGPLGLEAAWHFHQLGASVTLFGQPTLGGSARKMAQLFPELYGEYWTTHLTPLIEKIKQAELPIRGQVHRVHKRFLSLDEEVSGKSRLHDLFRVIYEMGEGENLAESYEDVDIVIDARGVLHNPKPIGASDSWALNEEKIRHKASIHYGAKIFEALKAIESGDRCLLVGTGTTAALSLVAIKEWLFSNPVNQLILATTEKSAFGKFFATTKNTQLKDSLLSLIKENERNWEKQKTEFEERIREWRDLDGFVKAKVPMPEEPRPGILLLEGHNVTAVDQLEDREGLFVTCENIAFRDNAEESIQTLAVDHIFGATGYCPERTLLDGLRTSWSINKKTTSSKLGDHPEPGFYTLGANDKIHGDRYSLQEGLEQLPALKDAVLTYFSPVETAE